MALPLPAQMKTGDITKYVQRASQLEKVKPIIAYWCNYNIINLILSKGLHTESEECMNYTTSLMEKLERFKSDNQGNDAVHDDVAAQAYVEQFAMETFQRADSALRARKATARTAETFHAAATFLDLLGIWQNPLNEEVAAKSKFSKYHAMRILKALKAGEDPNLTTELPEDPVQSAPALDPNDPEVQKIRSLQPTVQDAPPSPMDEDAPSHFNNQAPQSSSHTAGDVSPLDPEQSNDDYFPTTGVPSAPTVPSIPTVPSVGNVPNVPTFTAETSPSMSTAPVNIAPALPPKQNTQTDAQNFYTAPPAAQPPIVPIAKTVASPPIVPVLASTPVRVPSEVTAPFTKSTSQQYTADDDGILAAQKHARWAISALNFDDVPTAVRELKNALRRLGAE